MNYQPRFVWWWTCWTAAFLCAFLIASTARSQTSGTLRGKVVDGEGRPIADVQILVDLPETSRNREGKTQENGEFVIGGLRAGRYMLTFKKEGYQTAQQEVEVLMGESNRLGEIVIPRQQGPRVEPGAQTYFDTAMASIRAEDYQAAMESLETVVDLAPGFPEVHYNLGFVSEKLGKPEEAMKHYLAALELRPDYYEAHVAIADIYTKRQDWTKAAEHLRKAIEIRPNEVAAQYNYGAVAMNLGDMPAAYAAFEKVLELDPGRALAHYQLAMISVSQTRNEDAIAHLEKYLELEPNGAQAETARGILEQLKGKEAQEKPG